MYVILEYLTFILLVSLLGLVLFGAAVLGLVVKTGANKLADQATQKIPEIASRLSADSAGQLPKPGPQSPVHSA